MKYLLLLILFVPSLAFAQTPERSDAYKAGVELIKYEKKHTTGLLMQFGGSVLVALGAVNLDNNSTSETPVIIGGGALSLIGFIMQVTSGQHLRKAGKYLQGNKIVIPIK